MAYLRTKALFFTTSPRTPPRIIPEIQLLHEQFEGCKWDHATQEEFMDQLASADFFEGSGSLKDKAFSARDRINRVPKALGFVDLKPTIALTEAGKAFVYGKRPQEIFLRQLLKFQLPSPYHIESKAIVGTFYVRPYLEILRLIRELGYLTFDELKIFALRLTDYREFDAIKVAILAFRKEKESYKGRYKSLANDFVQDAILSIYGDKIRSGDLKTRETDTPSLKAFIRKKQQNLRDYADACFRYLHYTGLVSVAHRNRIITFIPDKLPEADYLLSTVERQPVHIDDEAAYKAHLFSSMEPVLAVDIKKNAIDALMRISGYTRRELAGKSIEDLKDLREEIAQRNRAGVISQQVEEIKSYAAYSEIIDTYNEIISSRLLDAPLMLEYNTWRAMTMLDGGTIKGNLKFDDEGQPLSTAQGNMPDIECDYGDFALSVEVTLQNGQRQYETEGEPVARHYGQLKGRAGKETYCLFIAKNLNLAAVTHFYMLNQIDNHYYGGKTQIIPLDLGQFMSLIEKAYNNVNRPTPCDVQRFLDSVISQVATAADEDDWSSRIQASVDAWLVP